MNGCHVCEVPEPQGVEQFKARMVFIAGLERGSPMWEHVVEHVRQNPPKGFREISTFAGYVAGDEE